MKAPRPFVVAWGPASKCWRVKSHVNWMKARELTILAPVLAYPDGTLRGDGVVRVRRGGIVIITA